MNSVMHAMAISERITPSVAAWREASDASEVTRGHGAMTPCRVSRLASTHASYVRGIWAPLTVTAVTRHHFTSGASDPTGIDP